ncbi:hypothetical protein CF326_g5635 [Tilletia indica]|nr:hypothetical protein CF326_g5635 [Tilletia indica]
MTTLILHFSVPSREILLEPSSEWTRRIHRAVQRVVSSSGDKDEGERLVFLFSLSSSLLAPPTALKLSFDELARFCQWSYAQAWGEAVRLDHLLLDVDVLLLPGLEGIENIVETEKERGKSSGRDIVLIAEEEVLNKLSSLPIKIESISSTDLPQNPSSTQDQHRPPTFPQHPVVALGGTFDHLHPGHKILLSTACAVSTRKLIIGITSDSMLHSKTEPTFLESLERRKERVRSFCSGFAGALRPGEKALELDVVTLEDVAGPAGSEADLQALVLTEETLAGGKAIAEIREKKGLGALQQYVIGVLGAKGETDLGGTGKDAKELAAAKVGSTAIRKWLAAKRRGE